MAPVSYTHLDVYKRQPLLTVQELAAAHVGMVLYPLSAFRAMNRAARCV